MAVSTIPTSARKTRAKSVKQLINFWEPEKEIDAGEGGEGSDDGSTGRRVGEDAESREHYLNVSEGKLKSQKPLEFDSKYDGIKVSRNELDFDSELNSDLSDEFVSANEGSDEEKEDQEDASMQGLDEMLGSSSDDIESDAEKINQIDDSEANDSGNDSEKDHISTLLDKQKQKEQELVSSLSKTAYQDRQKGQAVKNQLSLWEGLLDLRIRLQKGLDAANTLPQAAAFSELVVGNEESVSRASAELKTLFNSLLTLQLEMVDDSILPEERRSALKRSRNDELDTPDFIDQSWSQLQELETAMHPNRNLIIDKWNTKVQVSNGGMQTKFKVIDTSVVAQLEGMEKDKERLVKRTRLNRSGLAILGKETPILDSVDNNLDELVQAQKEKQEQSYDDQIFDDGDYYQQLLKELIESRMTDGDDPILLELKYAQMKQLQMKKVRKVVDTRASKGRKIRFQVHEKIQNFMAAEPRGDWQTEMAEELFASLLGKSRSGVEDVCLSDGFKIL